jgi:oxygen-independent coproporphyrinogen-3 oxidase
MCDLAVDLPRVSRLHGRDPRSAIVDRPRIESLIADGAVTLTDDRLSIRDGAAASHPCSMPSCTFRRNA